MDEEQGSIEDQDISLGVSSEHEDLDQVYEELSDVWQSLSSILGTCQTLISILCPFLEASPLAYSKVQALMIELEEISKSIPSQ